MAYGYFFQQLRREVLSPELCFGQTLPDHERDARIEFYGANGIGWIARPADGEPSITGDGTTFIRAGRFKKASNMNYALALSRKAERHLKEMVASGETAIGTSARVSLSFEGSGSTEDERAIPASLEERALMRAVEETWEESGKRWKPWAKNGRACRVGKIVLLVDSDTVVPEVRFLNLIYKSPFIDRPLPIGLPPGCCPRVGRMSYCRNYST